MPKILLPIGDVTESVLRPVVFDITRQLFKNTQMAADAEILYPGGIQRAQQPGAAIDVKLPGYVKFPFTSQMTVEATDDFNPDRMLDNNVFRPENKFIFIEDAIEAYIRPVYSTTQGIINYTYRAKDETEANRWRDMIRMHTAMNREHFVHTVQYGYVIPLEYMVILKELHRMREAVAGYGDPFDKWFAEHRSDAVTFVTNQSGSQGVWMVGESQGRIQGWFDWEGAPQSAQRQSDGDTWTFSISYRFQYERPSGCAMDYQLVVHNQFMDAKFRPGLAEQPPPGDRVTQEYRSWAAAMFEQFESNNNMYPVQLRQGYSLPEEDEFIPRQIIPNTQRVFTALIAIDPENPRFLLNLRDISPDYKLDADLFCCLEKEWPYMTKPWWSVFNLSLYQSADMLDWKFLTVDADLNVYTTFDMDLRRYYHLRFSIYTNLAEVNREALKRLQYCPDCLGKIIHEINPNYPENPFEHCLVEGRFVPMKCIDTVVDDMNHAKWDGRAMRTVQTFLIQNCRPIVKVSTPKG